MEAVCPLADQRCGEPTKNQNRKVLADIRRRSLRVQPKAAAAPTSGSGPGTGSGGATGFRLEVTMLKSEPEKEVTEAVIGPGAPEVKL
jgi:hypothetical protein